MLRKRMFLITTIIVCLILSIPVVKGINSSKPKYDKRTKKIDNFSIFHQKHKFIKKNSPEKSTTKPIKISPTPFEKKVKVNNLPPSSTVNYKNISEGKFYTFNIAPTASYPDIFSNEFTSGSKLTDGTKNNNSSIDNSVGWNSKNVEIILDLGKNTTIGQAKIAFFSNQKNNIYPPKEIKVQTSLDKNIWTEYSCIIINSSDKLTDNELNTRASEIKQTNSRYIKFIISQDKGYFLIDELQVTGEIINSRKKVPQKQCYYGAYAESNDWNGWMDIEDYENLTKRNLNMSLWYSDWNTSFNQAVKYVVESNLRAKNIYLELGFLPYYATSYEIASGKFDAFLKNWFIECKNLNYPIWIRPMNEMNGYWTFKGNKVNNRLVYGGDPENYKKAWRRMYNIAEQVGATGENQIFLWSPDARSEEGHNMDKYYPGHQYVDWVGVSAYVDKLNANGTYDSLDSLVNEIYSKYSQTKPVMISEGGAYESEKPDLKPNWIKEWFNLTKKKNIKAAVWFHRHEEKSNGVKEYGTRIDSSKASIEAYKP